MREIFTDKTFKSDSLALIKTINSILAVYDGQGYDLSLRQLYYQLVSKNIVENTERSYKNIGNLVSDARLAGMIDWNMIKDRGRSTLTNSHWTNPGEILNAAARSFRLDRWINQPCYVEVFVEKQALEGVLVPVCRQLDVPFTANKGYSSSSALYETSKRYVNAHTEGKVLHIIYLGDHDPSGIDMTRDVEERLDLFIKTSTNRTDEIGPNENPAARVHRIALNMDQVRKFKPPENPAKITDSRAADYIQKFGKSSWELDAIEPSKLASLVTTEVESLIDWDLWNEIESEEDGYKKQLLKFASTYEG